MTVKINHHTAVIISSKRQKKVDLRPNEQQPGRQRKGHTDSSKTVPPSLQTASDVTTFVSGELADEKRI